MPKRLDLTRHAAEPQGLLERILSTPRLAQVVPRLQPEIIHRVIQRCGLEDSSELVALATPEQLERVFDLDLWRATRPGRDEQFDAERFGIWLEVLAEAGADLAARKLAEMDPAIVTAGFAQHLRAFDHGAVSRFTTTDGHDVEEKINRAEDLTYDIGGYVAVARRTDSWEAIVAVLASLATDHPDCFDRVMSGCRAVSSAGREIDGLDDLLEAGDQAMFDVAFDREQRRETSGFVAPAEARAFLEASRRLRIERDVMPPLDPIARAHLGATPPVAATAPPLDDSATESLASVVGVLTEAGIVTPPQRPRALLTGPDMQVSRLRYIEAQMQFVLDRDPLVASQRNDELVFLANAIAAGCSVQARPLSPEEAWNAALAVCNLGLENRQPLPDDFLFDHNLVGVFQVGWTILHDEVVMYAAEQVLDVLATLRSHDNDIQDGLNALRITLTKHWRAGKPWRAQDALDVVTSLDMPAWAGLVGLLNECPVMHASVKAVRGSGINSVNPTDFEFISENSQIETIGDFLRSLGQLLRP
jgi:hypothetical protein